MKQLTPEQIKTLEDAFAGYPEDFKRTLKYSTMEGIQEQLAELDEELGFIWYISKARKNEQLNEYEVTMERMVAGVDISTPNLTTESTPKEPAESQIRKRMELTQESYYTARENLREEAYGATHTKSPAQSWGDYWKSY
jgi:hypothetical protein